MTSMLYTDGAIESSQKTKISRYAVELLGAMALYVMVLVAAIRAAPGIESHGLKMLACVSPMVPIALAISGRLRPLLASR